MPLLAQWHDRLAQVNTEETRPPATIRFRQDPVFHAERITLVDSAEAAQAMTDLARQQQVSWIGFHVHSVFDQPAIWIDPRHSWHDPRGIRPVVLSAVLCRPMG